MKLIDLKQGSQDWLDFRMMHIGGSDISAITGKNPWKTARDLWAEKTGKGKGQILTLAMEHGIKTEPEARETYQTDTGLKVEPAIYESSDWPIAMCSLDGITSDKLRILEIKCPSSPSLYERVLNDRTIPAYYMDQVQWNMAVSGVELCDFMVYMSPFEYSILEVKSDKKYQEHLFEIAKEFWGFVVDDIAPPLSENDTFEVVKDEGENSLLKRWKELEFQRKEIEHEQDAIASGIKQRFIKNSIFAEAGVKIKWTDRKGNIDWTKYKKDNKLKEEDLKPYQKEGIRYATMSIMM